MHGTCKPYRATGFGVVVVFRGGELLGFGFGTSPSHIASAAAAELWALRFVLSLNPFPPKVKTYCQSIISAARRGTSAVTHHSRQHARAWTGIVEFVGDDVSSLVTNGLVVWVLVVRPDEGANDAGHARRRIAN